MARILLVEDDDTLREVLAATLRAGHHVALEAANGRGVVAACQTLEVDLVVTDIVMPDQEGIGILIELRREYPDLPVIVMSGAVGRSGLYLELAGKLGARRTLTKPFTPGQFLQAVTEVLAEKRAPGLE